MQHRPRAVCEGVEPSFGPDPEILARLAHCACPVMPLDVSINVAQMNEDTLTPFVVELFLDRFPQKNIAHSINIPNDDLIDHTNP